MVFFFKIVIYDSSNVVIIRVVVDFLCVYEFFCLYLNEIMCLEIIMSFY